MVAQDLVTVVIGRFEPLVLRGLVETLREDGRIRVLATDLRGASLEHAVERTRPSLVILDDAVDHALMARLKALWAPTAILVLAHNPPRLYRSSLAAAGATCLARSSSAEQLTAAVRLAARAAGGARAEPQEHGGHASARETRTPAGRDLDLLTKREIDVLGYISRGLSYAEIAFELHLAEATVKTHSERIRRKLGVKSKRQLIDLRIPLGAAPTA